MGDVPLTVSEAVGLAKRTMNDLPQITVSGEVSGFKGPHFKSGHCYFELKDERSSMAIIVWRTTYAKLAFALKDGMEITAKGTFDVFGRTGKLSFIASAVEVAGEGALRQKVAELARRLAAEGLMAKEAKRPIPQFCERVALVTSFSGSVRADVLRTLARRNPLVEVDMVACAVQGEGASASMREALAVAANAHPDAILLVRGGGSFEDLMAFNNEALARAIAASPVPVVTGIGHEPDVTIADMVADRRQSTPTAAAESVAPTFDQLAKSLDSSALMLGKTMRQRVEEAQALVEALAQRLGRALLYGVACQRQWLEVMESSRVFTDAAFLTKDELFELDRQEERMANALPRGIARQKDLLAAQEARFGSAGARLGEAERHKVEGLAATLEALSPWGVLDRGYAILRKKRGGVVSRAEEARVGEELLVQLKTGELGVVVNEVNEYLWPQGARMGR